MNNKYFGLPTILAFTHPSIHPAIPPYILLYKFLVWHRKLVSWMDGWNCFLCSLTRVRPEPEVTQVSENVRSILNSFVTNVWNLEGRAKTYHWSCYNLMILMILMFPVGLQDFVAMLRSPPLVGVIMPLMRTVSKEENFPNYSVADELLLPEEEIPVI